MLNKFILSFIFLSFTIFGFSYDFDNIYKLNGGTIDTININGKQIKYYHYLNKNKSLNNIDNSNYVIKFNKNIDSNIENFNKLKSINAVSFETQEFNLIKLISSKFNKYINNIEYIEKIPNKTVFEAQIMGTINKDIKMPMDKYVGADEVSTYSPNDPFASKQWYLMDQIDDIDIGYLGYRKFLKETNFKTDLKSAVIGIVDIGIFYDYPDLVNRIYVNNREIPNNNKDDDNNGYIDDYKGVDVGHPECVLSDTVCANMYKSHHGTMMASVIASQTDNGIDIAGIVPNEVKILPINSSKDREYVDTYIEAYDYLLDMKSRGVNIIGFNISAGGPASRTEYLYMKKFEQADILVIASAGNEKTNIDPMNGYTMENDNMPVYPAKYDNSNIISVGAYNESGNVASFSNYGSRVHVYLPGNNILSQPYPELDKLNYVAGTSPAAAVMSGIFGVGKYLYPNVSNIELRNAIVNRLSESMGTYKLFDVKTIKISSTYGKGLLTNNQDKTNSSIDNFFGIGIK
jgi:hypothetical protein